MCVSNLAEGCSQNHQSKFQMSKDLNSRICIVGAGAAGLSAAEALKEKGYTNVTVLEREAFAGGKCRSVEIEGKIYELGAGAVAHGHTNVMNLAKKYDAKMDKVNFEGSLFLGPKIPKKVLRSVIELIRYYKLSKKYAKDLEPGYAGVSKDLCVPFSEFADKNGIAYLAKLFLPHSTGFGYGYFDEVPAAYMLTYNSLGLIKSFLKRKLYVFPDGMQCLWETVANHHNVIYECEIEGIERGEKVHVLTNKGDMEFDRLILTAPLDESVDYLDVQPKEMELFGKIKYVDYVNFMCVLIGFPEKIGYIPNNLSRSKSGHPVFWYYRHKGTHLYNFYILGDWKITDEEMQKNIEEVVRREGGSVEEFQSAVHWKYFPHVSSKDMADGFYDQLESLQGVKNTYYAGEIMNFSSVELSSAYSYSLIESRF